MPRPGSREETPASVANAARAAGRDLDPIRESLDELSRIADDLVDQLALDEPDLVETTAPEPPQLATPAEKVARGDSLRETLSEIDRLHSDEPPPVSVEVEVAGDRGEDIQEHLDSLFSPPPTVAGEDVVAGPEAEEPPALELRYSQEPDPPAAVEQEPDPPAALEPEPELPEPSLDVGDSVLERWSADADPAIEIELPEAADAGEVAADSESSFVEPFVESANEPVPPTAMEETLPALGQSEPAPVFDEREPATELDELAAARTEIAEGLDTAIAAAATAHEGSRSRRLLWVAVACIALIALAGVLWLLQGRGEDSASGLETAGFGGGLGSTTADVPAIPDASSYPGNAGDVPDFEPAILPEDGATLGEDSEPIEAPEPEPDPAAIPAPEQQPALKKTSRKVSVPRPEPPAAPPAARRAVTPRPALRQPSDQIRRSAIEPVGEATTLVASAGVVGELLTASVEPPAVPSAAPVGETRPPVAVSRIEPSYPARARKRGDRGTVVLNVLVNETGKVVRVVVDEGIPGSALEAAAIDAVLHWAYDPALEDGEPVSDWTRERFTFEP